jgi:para-nitrobenzyl esterase
MGLVGDEDCLTLNVFRPQTLPDHPLPVLFFIHGGGNAQGASSKPIYEGSHLAAQGGVVVTANYRLGPFGYLAHPGLSAESGHIRAHHRRLRDPAAFSTSLPPVGRTTCRSRWAPTRTRRRISY